MKKTLIAFVLCHLFAAGAAHAATIVDTGPGPDTQTGWWLSSEQWLAGEFSLGTATTISGVQGWIYGNGTATAAIYTDGGEIPGTELFSAAFTANGTSAADWYGASGLSWLLDAGTYWMAFEVRTNQTLDGGMPNPSGSELINEAFSPSWSAPRTYYESDYLGLGVRIFGEQGGQVPEPASLALLGIGLAGLGLSRRRKA